MTHQEAIRILYRHASVAAHPDTGGDTETMSRVNQARDILSGRYPASPPPPPPAPARCTRPHIDQPLSDPLMRWGKFRHEPMSDLPLGYLAWIVENIHDDPGVVAAARAWLLWLAATGETA
jgi:hypothetical protein